MPRDVTRRGFWFQTLGIIGGTMVAGDLLPLLAQAAKRKQVLRVAIEGDFETLRPELSAGDTVNMLRRLIYTTPILWGMRQRPDGSLIYDPDAIEMVLASSYKVSEDRQLIEFTLRNNAKFANGDPINAQALKESYAWFLGARGSGQLKVNGVPSADHIEVVDEVTVRLRLDRPVAWGLIGNALLSSSGIIHANEVMKHATADDPYGTKWLETKTVESGAICHRELAKRLDDESGTQSPRLPVLHTRTHHLAGRSRSVYPAHCLGTRGCRFCGATGHQRHPGPAQGLGRQSGIVSQRPWVVVGDDLEQGPI